MHGAAHKPGAFPLRPLKLSDIYDATFRIIRFNPKATVGAAVLVSAVAMALPVALSSVLGLTTDVALLDPAADPATQPAPTGEELAVMFGYFGSLAVGSLLQGLGLILVTGMVVHVVMASATGHRLTLGQAWRATHGKRWALIGLSLLLGLMLFAIFAIYTLLWVLVVVVSQGDWVLPVVWGVLSVPALLVLMFFLWIRVFYFPAAALMLERVGVVGAIGRGWRLTTGRFWPTFGVALLTFVLAQVGGSIIAVPLTLLAQGVLLAGVPGEQELLLFTVVNAVSTVLSAAFITPFTSAVTSLQYVDLRMRKEAFDVELMQRAGLTGR